MAGAYTVGIEEEYFLVDAATKTVAAERPEAFFAAAKAALGTQVRGELLQSQIEVTTEPHHDMSTARATSSPFWRSRPTGLMGYRLAAYDELPRTGVPELFRKTEEFEAYIAALTKAGIIDDASYVWWALRPSLQHPTLELRAPDCCTFVDDSIAIAALYRALTRRLCRNPWLNAEMTAVSRAIVVENKWRAQRYGVSGTFASHDGSGAITVAEMLEQVLAEVLPDAEELGCSTHASRCRTIVGGGTSADAQLAVFQQHEKSESRERALEAVNDWLAAAT